MTGDKSFQVFVYFANNIFTYIITNLLNKTGVYSFWGTNNQPLYIGRSINLGQRVPKSYENTWHQYLGKRYINDNYRPIINKPVFFKYMICNEPDSYIIEPYLIFINKPLFNNEFRTEDYPTLKIHNIPFWSQPILCNRVILKRWGL